MIAPPPDEAQLALDDEAMPQSSSGNGGYGSAFGGGPPPGLSAYRSSAPAPYGTAQPGNTSPWGNPPPPSRQGEGGAPPPGSPFRQTIMGLPQVSPPQYQAPAPPSPASAKYADRRPMPAPAPGTRGRFPLAAVGALGLLVVAGVMLYNFFYRPGTMRIDVTPADAIVEIDGEVLKGSSPFTVRKPPGAYNLSFRKEGYSKHSQTVQIEAGGDDKIEVPLEASADTGFELTSDPPGQLVWLDGVPFTGTDPAGPQARTDFKATRVSPGRHVLEIKGDPRFKVWRHEFYQEPGRILVIPATLEPVTPGTAALAGRGGIPRPVERPVPVAAVPSPPPTTAPAPIPTPPPPATPPPAPAAPTTTAPAVKTSPTSAPAVATAPVVERPPVPAAARPAEPRPRPATSRPAPVATAPEPSSGTDPAAAPAPVRPAASCLVSIGARPWAEVWIDGRNTGKVTPLIDHRVPCGRRRITLKNPDLGTEKTDAVNVKPGERFKKIYQLLDEEN
jgi:hypothetical protein